jgi:hypothetical protein
LIEAKNKVSRTPFITVELFDMCVDKIEMSTMEFTFFVESVSHGGKFEPNIVVPVEKIEPCPID